MNSQGKTTPERPQDATKQVEQALGPDAVRWLRDHNVLGPFVRLVGRHCDPGQLWAGLDAIKLSYDAENPQREGISVQADTTQRAVRDLAVKNRVQAKAQPAQAGGPTYEPLPEHAVELFSPRTFTGATGFDRSELRTVIKRMRRCADDLKRLDVRSICHVLSDKYRFPPKVPGWFPPVEGRPSLGDVLAELAQLFDYAENLPWRLRVLALAAEDAAKHIYLRERPLYDSAVASLVRYVRQATGRLHDEEVSALIAVVTERPNYDAVAHSDWRKRNLKLLG